MGDFADNMKPGGKNSRLFVSISLLKRETHHSGIPQRATHAVHRRTVPPYGACVGDSVPVPQVVQGILEKVAIGKELITGGMQFAAMIADYVNSRYEVDGCWIETPRQKHDRFLDLKHQREKLNLEEATG